ncbi:MarR family winged helix-turn-helix transcriptional regulator [Kitasatospora paracochleata]|uniref:DNA-binding MarR family transcriptional regulator n=1 Tax=Kitasatospora paracochleata TaxID=58354 RepID=A0ABT1IZB7_9ACTN|nr:MarR family transcriptional regulator [Kitasatospora paracochleata]MCP2310274.1 DNA-binding MarR family transcriptional regulator [Kitasatospora paracochleata]
MTTPPTADTAAELADALTRAMKRIRRQTMRRLEPYGITPGQARALRTLAHAPGCEGRETMRLSELAERLHIAPRSATTVVDALEEAGLVTRTPDPADRRAVRLVLTENGWGALERIGQVRHEVAQEYFGPVGPAEQDALLRALRAAEAAYEASADGAATAATAATPAVAHQDRTTPDPAASDRPAAGGVAAP